MGHPKKTEAATGIAASETRSFSNLHSHHTAAAAGAPESSRRRYRVVTTKANGTRVVFSKHETRRAADDMAAALARISCPAQVERAIGDDAKPGEALA